MDACGGFGRGRGRGRQARFFKRGRRGECRDFQVDVEDARRRPLVAEVLEGRLRVHLGLPAQPAVGTVKCENRPFGGLNEGRAVIERAVATGQGPRHRPRGARQRRGLAGPDGPGDDHGVVAPDRLLAMAKRQPRPARAIDRQPGITVHVLERVGRVFERIGGEQDAAAVDDRDHDLARAIQAGALAVEQVDGVLAPVGRTFFIGDPDSSARIGGHAGPSLKLGRAGHGDRRAERAVGLAGTEQDIVIACLVAVERHVDPAARVGRDAEAPTRWPACR